MFAATTQQKAEALFIRSTTYHQVSSFVAILVCRISCPPRFIVVVVVVVVIADRTGQDSVLLRLCDCSRRSERLLPLATYFADRMDEDIIQNKHGHTE